MGCARCGVAGAVLLIVGCIPSVLLWHRSVTVVPVFNLLDWSWTLDTSYKAASGVWFGRDVLFTYGPLYQYLASAPSRWIGISTGTILATSEMLPALGGVLAIFVSLRLLLPNVSSWKRALLLAVVFLSPPGIRLSICLLAFVIFIRLAHAVASRRDGTVLYAFGAAAICLASFLVSADAGIYCIAALLLCLAAAAIVKMRTSGAVIRLCVFSLATCGCLAILMVAANAVMSSPLDFSYLKSSLILATSYRWFEPNGITTASTWRILGALALGIAAFSVAWRHQNPGGNYWTLRPAFLLSGFSLAVFMMQSGLVQSDALHVANGVYPLVFLSGAILIERLAPLRWLSGMLLASFPITAPC